MPKGTFLNDDLLGLELDDVLPPESYDLASSGLADVQGGRQTRMSVTKGQDTLVATFHGVRLMLSDIPKIVRFGAR